jgi:nucleoid DNA-binding protein
MEKSTEKNAKKAPEPKTEPKVPEQKASEPKTPPRKRKEVLTKRHLCLWLANKHDLTQEKSIEVVQSILNEIISALRRGQNVEFREFGVFTVLVRKARVGRNPKKPSETIAIPERRNVKFKPGRMMRLMLKRLKD